MTRKYLDYDGLVQVFKKVDEKDSKLENDITLVLNGMYQSLDDKADKEDVYDRKTIDKKIADAVSEGGSGDANIVTLTQKEYDNLEDKDKNTLYAISDADPLGFKTINGESIIGEGDIEIKGGGTNSPFEEYNEGVRRVGNTNDLGFLSFAENTLVTASGDCAHAEGAGTEASSDYSHAEGNNTSATNCSEHASGQFNISTTVDSNVFTGDKNATLFSVGNGKYKNNHNAFEVKQNGDIYIPDTSASGEHYEKPMIHLQEALKKSGGGGTDSPFEEYNEGVRRKGNVSSIGKDAYAESKTVIASGNFSHAEGDLSVASGYNSHAEGLFTTASGDYSHTEGNYTEAKNENEHASGLKNISTKGTSNFGDADNTLFSVGNGSNTTPSVFHNAFEIKQNGDIYIPDTSAEGEYYEKPMIKLQDALKKTSGGGSGNGYSKEEADEKFVTKDEVPTVQPASVWKGSEKNYIYSNPYETSVWGNHGVISKIEFIQNSVHSGSNLGFGYYFWGDSRRIMSVPNATQEYSGCMSAADKVKLDSLEPIDTSSFATNEYVDSKLGDINNILENILG